MNEIIYRQFDSRWGSLPYPGSGSCLSDSGCGCFAVLHCAIDLDKYKNLTPFECRDYMVQFATVKNGTLWSGITKGLEHYGFNVHWNEADSMEDVFRELKDSLKSGVILFAKKKGYCYGPDGTLWTTTGHYIYFGDYKIEADGTHWFYLKDSGTRMHDGWWCFEKSMKGCCRNVWINKSADSQPTPPSPTPTPPSGEQYPGPYPVVKKYLEPGDKGENVTRLQNYLNWYTDGKFFNECGGADGVYGKNTLKYVKQMQSDFFGASEADGLVGPKTIARMKAYCKPAPAPAPTPTPQSYTGAYPTEAEIRTASNNGIHNAMCTWAKWIADLKEYKYKKWSSGDAKTHECPICHNLTGKYKGWNCIGFAFACWHHIGIPSKCNCQVISDSVWEKILNAKTDADALKLAQDRIGIKDIKVIRNKNGIPKSQLEKGDILSYFKNKTSGYHHTVLYVGNGKVADSSPGNSGEYVKYGKTLNASETRVAIRYTGSRNYLQKGDEGTAVTDLQNYLDCYTDGAFFRECGAADGHYGNNTYKYVVKMQTDFFGEKDADGTVGPLTIAKMKEVRK